MPDEEDVVFYCGKCHSLHILVDDTMADDEWDGSYCARCNSTDVRECTMEEWLAEEEKRRKKREEIEWNR